MLATPDHVQPADYRALLFALSKEVEPLTLAQTTLHALATALDLARLGTLLRASGDLESPEARELFAAHFLLGDFSDSLGFLRLDVMRCLRLPRALDESLNTEPDTRATRAATARRVPFGVARQTRGGLRPAIGRAVEESELPMTPSAILDMYEMRRRHFTPEQASAPHEWLLWNYLRELVRIAPLAAVRYDMSELEYLGCELAYLSHVARSASEALLFDCVSAERVRLLRWTRGSASSRPRARKRSG